MSLDFYDKLLTTANLRRNADAGICGQRAYYSARDPLRGVRKVAGQYEGAIKQGECIDCTYVTPPIIPSQPCDGLAGSRILFVCGKKPTCKVFSRSNIHRGNRGLLRKDFVCRILVTYALPAGAAKPPNASRNSCKKR